MHADFHGQQGVIARRTSPHGIMDSSEQWLRAAEYVRMSTEHQRFSTENQQTRIREYALSRRIEVVKTYLDPGRSGLQLRGRSALQALLADVISGEAAFDLILVYDVSRWGRFQDADEAAHYEFLCRRAGKRVLYCAEPFDNDLTPMATLIKGIKRVMAGEYSRELSEKVSQGLMRSAAKGFFVGGPCPYGLRRVVVDAGGRRLAVLQAGEHKAVQRGRVILVPGPKLEVAVVQKVFDWFVNEGLEYTTIARRLNQQQVALPANAQHPTWTKERVKSMLANEKYVGNLVFNRCTEKLKTARRANPPERWIRRDGVFSPIIEAGLFEAAAKRIAANPRLTPESFMLSRMQELLAQHGRLSAKILRTLTGGPGPVTLARHFGSLHAAFAAAGYDPSANGADGEQKRQRSYHTLTMAKQQLVDDLRQAGAQLTYVGKRTFVVNQRLHVAIVCPSPNPRCPRGRVYWQPEIDLLVIIDHAFALPNHPVIYVVPRGATSEKSFLIDGSARTAPLPADYRCPAIALVARVLDFAEKQPHATL